MKKYDYFEALRTDIEIYISNECINIHKYGDDIDEAFDKLNDELWEQDSVTGNGGMYYDTETNCEEYLCHNLDLLFAAIEDFDFDISYKNIHQPYLACTLDSLIRCYLLNQVLWEYMEENWDDSTTTN